MKKLKEYNSLNYKVDVYVTSDKVVRLNGFLDTGNTLLEPYKKRKVVVAYSKELESIINEKNIILVPFESINGKGLLKCIKVDKLYIEGIGIKKDVVVGLSKEKIKKNGINCILNYLLLEE